MLVLMCGVGKTLISLWLENQLLVCDRDHRQNLENLGHLQSLREIKIDVQDIAYDFKYKLVYNEV